MTKTIRSTTDEMLAARFDPEPWVDSDGSRSAYIGGETPGVYLPRPGYIPTRDPHPWATVDFDGSVYRLPEVPDEYAYLWHWSPRPEYARPEPNPILVALREYVTEATMEAFMWAAEHWLWIIQDDPASYTEAGDMFRGANATPAQIEDARKVLTRIVGVFG